MATEPLSEIKACCKCGIAKPATTEFFVKKLAGLSARCKPCLQKAKRDAWARKAEGINAARRAARNDETRRRDRQRYAAAPERKRANVRAWREANPDKRREIDRRHYEKFRDKKVRQASEWGERNPDRKRRNVREFYRRKRATDPMYRLRAAVSSLIYGHLKSGKGGKRTEEVLGYTTADLRQHLERQFEHGMSWDNYGEWHVDHILPVASFKFETADDPEFRACWALSNLRPLWAAENIRKSDKRLHLI